LYKNLKRRKVAYFKKIRRTPTTIFTVGFAAAAMFSACGTYTAAVQNDNTKYTAVDTGITPSQDLLFIEDFYAEDASKKAEPRLTIDYTPEANLRGQLKSADEQLPISEQLVLLGENIRLSEQAENENIGGLDYATPEEAEDFEVYDDLFLANELNAGAIFDPSKMTDSIQVFLVSPFSNCYTFPLGNSKVNSDFGWRKSRFHSGIDLDLEVGDDVYASFDGIVKKADVVSGYGNLIVVKHFNGLETYYAHLSKILVAEGDTVSSGEKIALGGNTGRSTGPHLHYELRYRGAAINPRYIIDFKNEDLIAEMFYLKKEHFKPTTSTTNAAASTTAKKYYTVKKGDTLGKIASRNHTTVAKICKLNGISSKKVLKPGQRLRIK